MGLPFWPFGTDIKTVSDMIEAQKDMIGLEKKFETGCPFCGSTDIYSANWAPDRCRGCGALEAGDNWYFDSKEEMELARRIIARRSKPGNENLDFDGFFDQLELEKKAEDKSGSNGPGYATGGLVKTSTTLQLSDLTKKELTDMQEAFRQIGSVGIKGAEAGKALGKSMETLKLAIADDGSSVEMETVIHYSSRGGVRAKDFEVDVNTGQVIWESEARKKEQAEAAKAKEQEPKTRAIDI